MKTRYRFAMIGLLGVASVIQAPLAMAQDQNRADDQNIPQENTDGVSNNGWRRLGDAPDRVQQGSQDVAQLPPDYAQQRGPAGPPPDYRNRPQGGEPEYRPDYRNEPRPGRPAGPPPAQLNIAAGTFFTIRVNQPLSSNRNQPGDAFTAQLVKPIVVDGIIVADRGQTIAGRVAEVDKGGRVKGVSHLGIELTELSLVDGQQIPLRSQLISHTAPGSVGRDATAVGTTTGFGALIGAAAAGGEGAAIGAGAGAAASVIGVLLTKGHPTIIYPESILTFRIEAPITINTTRAPMAFREVEQGDYNQPGDQPRLQTRTPGYGAPPYYGGGYYGPGWGYPGYYGGVGVVFGPRYYYGGGFRGGYRGGGYRGGGFRGRR
jgi:hypothetical protein